MSTRQTIPALLPDLRAYARSLCENWSDAEDLVSDAIERALRTENAPNDAVSLRPWLFRVIRNLNVDDVRKKHVRREYSRQVTRIEYEEHKSHHSVTEDLDVRLAFEKLKTTEKEILLLIDILGMKYSEASEILEVPAGTVMSRLSRARRTFINMLESSQLS